MRPDSSVLTASESVSALATGRFDRDKSIDLAVAAGDELTLLTGARSGEPAVRRTLPSGIRALSFGRFVEDDRSGRGLAVLLDDGRIRLLRSTAGEEPRLTIVEDRVPAGSGARTLWCPACRASESNILPDWNCEQTAEYLAEDPRGQHWRN